MSIWQKWEEALAGQLSQFLGRLHCLLAHALALLPHVLGEERFFRGGRLGSERSLLPGLGYPIFPFQCFLLLFSFSATQEKNEGGPTLRIRPLVLAPKIG